MVVPRDGVEGGGRGGEDEVTKGDRERGSKGDGKRGREDKDEGEFYGTDKVEGDGKVQGT